MKKKKKKFYAYEQYFTYFLSLNGAISSNYEPHPTLSFLVTIFVH